MTTETDSNAIVDDVDLDAFSSELFGGGDATDDTVQTNEPSPEDADDTSPSDADDTKPEDTPEDADPDSNEGDEKPEEVPEKRTKKTAAERIAEVVAQREAEKAEKEELRAELERLRAAPADKKEVTPETPATANDNGEPDPDEFLEDGVTLKYPLGEYDPKYLADRVDWLFASKEAQITQEREQKAEFDKLVAARTELQQTWDTRLQEAEKTEEMADIREAGAVLISELSEKVSPEYGDYLATTIMGMEMGPEVFYFLASNPDVAEVIATQDAVNATIALGALGERIRYDRQGNAPEKAKPPRVTQAPEPPNHVTRGNSGRFETPADTDDQNAFEAMFFQKRKR